MDSGFFFQIAELRKSMISLLSLVTPGGSWVNSNVRFGLLGGRYLIDMNFSGDRSKFKEFFFASIAKNEFTLKSLLRSGEIQENKVSEKT